MKKTILLIFFIVILVNCTHNRQNSISQKHKPTKTTFRYSQNIDSNINPGDNFYQFANGGWLKKNDIPSGYNSWGNFDVLHENNLKKLRLLLDQTSKSTKVSSNTELTKIKDFYISGLDTNTIEKLGLTPLNTELEHIYNIETISDLRQELAHFHRLGIDIVFNISAQKHHFDKPILITSLNQVELGLQNRTYYIKQDKYSKQIRSEYKLHLFEMFKLLGDNYIRAMENANIIISIETRLAKSSTTPQLLDDNQKNTIYSLKNITNSYPNIDFNNYINSIGLQNTKKIMVNQPLYLSTINTMLEDTDVFYWQTYMRWKLVDSITPFLNPAFTVQNNKFSHQFLKGFQNMNPSWERSLFTTNEYLDNAIEKVFTDEFLNKQTKHSIANMVRNIKNTFVRRIKNLEWMSESTKNNALLKLKALEVKIGYAKNNLDFSTLEIDQHNYVRNVININRLRFQSEIIKLNNLHKDEYLVDPNNVNAYYNPYLNEIVLPSTLLQSPLFDQKGDLAVNYGGIGSIIAHEIIHGFDNLGKRFDIDGNINNWWTQDDSVNFNKLSQSLINQYNNYIVVDTCHINGTLTLCENIADLGGLSISFEALQQILKNKTNTIDGFNPSQRFFITWANIWKTNIKKDDLIYKLQTDVHSPSEFRVNGTVFNISGFYEAFNISPHSNMYIPPENRIAIW